MELLFLAPAMDCTIALEALDLPENLTYVGKRLFTLHGRNGQKTPREHKCFVVAISDTTLDSKGQWQFHLSSTVPDRGLYLPEPADQSHTDTYFAYGTRLREIIQGPDLFLRNRAGTRPALLYDPLTTEDHVYGRSDMLEHDTRYLRRLRYLEVGSYRFDVHMLGSECDSPSSPDITRLLRVAQEIPAGLSEKEFLPTEHVLGQGNFGMVYITKGVHTGRMLACKEMMFDRKLPNVKIGMERALEERKMSLLFKHPNIIRAFWGDECDERDPRTGRVTRTRHRIMMEPCPFSLEHMIEIQLADKYLTRAALDMTRGLAFLHEQEVAHRDLKPGNVLVRFEKLDQHIFARERKARHRYLDFTQQFRFCLSDFGLSRRKDDVFRTFCGTRRYLAPELRAKDDDANKPNVLRLHDEDTYTTAVDVYALGITLFEIRDSNGMGRAMGDGSVPRWANFKDLVKARRHDDWMWYLISRMLLDDPAERPEVHEIGHELRIRALAVENNTRHSAATEHDKVSKYLSLPRSGSKDCGNASVKSPGCSDADSKIRLSTQLTNQSESPDQVVLSTIRHPASTCLHLRQPPLREMEVNERETFFNLHTTTSVSTTTTVTKTLMPTERTSLNEKCSRNGLTGAEPTKRIHFRFPDRLEGLFDASLDSNNMSVRQVQPVSGVLASPHSKGAVVYKNPDRLEALFDFSIDSASTPPISTDRPAFRSKIHKGSAGPRPCRRYGAPCDPLAGKANLKARRSVHQDPLAISHTVRVKKRSRPSRQKHVRNVAAAPIDLSRRPITTAKMLAFLSAIPTVIFGALTKAFDNAIDNEHLYKDSVCGRVPGAFY